MRSIELTLKLHNTSELREELIKREKILETVTDPLEKEELNKQIMEIRARINYLLYGNTTQKGLLHYWIAPGFKPQVNLQTV